MGLRRPDPLRECVSEYRSWDGLSRLRKQGYLCHTQGPCLPLTEKGLDPERACVW